MEVLNAEWELGWAEQHGMMVSSDVICSAGTRTSVRNTTQYDLLVELVLTS